MGYHMVIPARDKTQLSVDVKTRMLRIEQFDGGGDVQEGVLIPLCELGLLKLLIEQIISDINSGDTEDQDQAKVDEQDREESPDGKTE